MEIDYLYTKFRKDFGRQCIFLDEGPKLIEDLKSDNAMMDKYIYKNPIDKGTQCSSIMSEHYVNTSRAELVDHGMEHSEGGWPKEIDTQDEEAVIRFRKKVERSDNYIASLKHMLKPMEHAILQNNAVNIYEQYFVGEESLISVERPTSRLKNTYRDPCDPKRPVTHLSWSPSGTEFAVSYSYMTFQRCPLDSSYKSYIWDVENSNSPYIEFEGKMPIVSLEWNPRDSHSLVAGMYSGQVAFFDTRRAPEPIEYSSVEKSHRDPVHSVLWINSKSGMEFFSASSDGTVKWWDCRRLDEPLDAITLDLTKGEAPIVTRAYGASCLEYDQTIPVKYMVGTENGNVIAGNRKGTNHQEKLPWVMKAHFGPIYSIHRNQAFSKNFLTVGDWTARIWSEDCKESSIMWTKYHKIRLTGGEWSPTRYSVFFLIRSDGVMDLYDILQNQKEPLLSIKFNDYALTCLRVHEDGELAVVADENGSTYLVQFSENLATSTKNDKTFLAAMFDRESHREKILESRNREIRLKAATKLKEQEQAAAAAAAAIAAQEFGLEEEEEVVRRTESEEAVMRLKEAYESDYFAEIEKMLNENETKVEGNKSKGESKEPEIESIEESKVEDMEEPA